MKKIKILLNLLLIITVILGLTVQANAVNSEKKDEDDNKQEIKEEEEKKIHDETIEDVIEKNNLEESNNPEAEEKENEENKNQTQENDNGFENIEQEDKENEAKDDIEIVNDDFENNITEKKVMLRNSNQNIEENKEKIDGVSYKTHVQDVGWQGWKKDGEMAGTSGRSLRLEGIYIKLNNADGINVKYQTHIQDVGWQGWKKNGEFSGTEGRSLRLEGIKIELENSEKYSIAYRVHVQDIGWQDWHYDGEMAGTEGRSLRLEGIEIKIVEKVKRAKLCIDTNLKDVYYKNEIIEVAGWKMATQKDMQLKVLIDGKDNVITEKDISYRERPDVIKAVKGYGTIKENPTPGFKFQLNSNDLEEGKHTIKITVADAKGEVKASYSKTIKIDKQMRIFYQTHIQDIGWQGYRENGETSGTSGRALRLEALKIKGANLPEGVTIKYKTHVQDISWQSWKQNDEIAGTSGKGLRLEALKIRLEGTEEYSVMYRTHVENIGWQEWCYDGENAGTEGNRYRLEAVQIKIVPKIKKSKATLCIDYPKSRISNEIHNVKGWIMASMNDISLKIFIDNKELSSSGINRTKRQDVLNAIKGYGDFNPNPGYEISVDFSKYGIGTHSIKVQAINNNNVIAEETKEFEVRNKITYSSGTYGVSGLKQVGDSRGTDLKYYKYGNGPNVFYLTCAIHGFEDLWYKDGSELVEIADKFYNTLIRNEDYDISDKWTIYIFPGVNMDGLNYGYTNDGPGRTTLTSAIYRGIDLNRCWSADFQANYTDRNYTGDEPFLAFESRYLRDFLTNHKSANGQTVLVDLHGWTQQLIGNEYICDFYEKYFPENDKSSVGRYGRGYLIGWARKTLGNTRYSAKSALIELPNAGINGHQAVLNNNLDGRFIQSTLDMLKGIKNSI